MPSRSTQAACKLTHPGFEPRPPPTPFDEEEKADGKIGGEDDESTVAPLYYAWSTLPPPKAKAKGKIKKVRVFSDEATR